METTYVLTAEMDKESFDWLSGLRREHFPAERNFLPAHLTLFHRLSSAQVAILHLIEVPRGLSTFASTVSSFLALASPFAPDLQISNGCATWHGRK